MRENVDGSVFRRAHLSIHLLSTLRGAKGGVYDLAFSADGTLLIAADRYAVRLWQRQADGQYLPAHTLPAGFGMIALSPDSQTIAVPGYTGGVQLWSLSGTLEEELPLDAEATGVCFSPDGRLLLIGGHTGLVRVWDRLAHTFCTTFQGASAPDTDSRPSAAAFLTFSPDGTRLVLCCPDQRGIVQFWDMKYSSTSSPGTPEFIWVEALGDQLDHYIYQPTFSPDGQILATVNVDDDQIELFDTQTLTRTQVIRLPSETPTPVCLAFSPDEGYLAAATFNGWVCIWETKTWELLTSFAAHTEFEFCEEPAMEALAWSPNSQIIATGGNAASYIWDRLLRRNWFQDGFHVKLWLVEQSEEQVKTQRPSFLARLLYGQHI
jgi:WD40 repeat protein